LAGLAGAAAAGAAAVARRRLTGAAAAGAVARRLVVAAALAGAAAVRRVRVVVVVAFLAAAAVARGRRAGAAAAVRRGVARRAAAAVAARPVALRATTGFATLRAAAFALAATSWVPSFATFAASRSLRRRSCAISFATELTCRRRAASAPPRGLRGAALRAAPAARVAVALGVAGVRRVLVRAMDEILLVLLDEHFPAD
jgi:hypothetical protein